MSGWTELALPTLRAVHEWSNVTPPGQAISSQQLAERAGLSANDPAYLNALRTLIADGYLDAAELITQTTYDVMVKRITALGLQALGEWPSANAEADIEAKKRARAALMLELYDAADGARTKFTDIYSAGDNVHLPRAVTDEAANYLEGEDLIEFVSDQGLVHLTHRGIVEVEAGRQRPNDPTEHFPPVQNVIHVYGPMSGSIVAQAGSHSEQSATALIEGMDVARIVRAVRDAISPLDLDPAERDMVDHNLAVAEANAQSDGPGKRVALSALRSVRAIVEGLVASGTYAELSHLLTVLPGGVEWSV